MICPRDESHGPVRLRHGIVLSTHFMKRVKMRVRISRSGVAGEHRHDVMISANDLISLYMGLELQSLALYVIAAINRDSAKSSEAGLKYFVLGALSSGMLLYGASLVYGFTGTTSFPQIAAALTATVQASALCSALYSSSQALPSRYPPCPSTCGRLMFMKGAQHRLPLFLPPPQRLRPWHCLSGHDIALRHHRPSGSKS